MTQQIGNPYLRAVNVALQRVKDCLCAVGTGPADRALEEFERADYEIRRILAIPPFEDTEDSLPCA